MTIEDIKITIKNHILNSITHRDLCILCNIFEIPTTGRRLQIQKRLVDSILIATNVDLLHRILYMINRPNRDSNGANQLISSQTRDVVQGFIQNDIINSTEIERTIPYQTNGYNQRNTGPPLNSKLYCISNEVLDSCPIDLRPEIINGIDPLNIFIANYTKYPCGNFNAPSTSPTVINGRVTTPNVQLPYCVKNTVISSSQFYCCQVVLHPLCLLIPKPTPNMCQPSRVMSKMQLTFRLSNSARHLITAHQSQVNNKRFYKWQVLIRFGIYDPSKPFPQATSDNSLSTLPEYIPPYLTLYVNNVNVPLWDILPSNSTAKEGKRHPRPINISDYLKFSPNADEQGYQQSINVNWWQTPGVYQYYYFAVYLERKLSVNELYNRFVSKTHHVQMPIDFTINFIRDKFSTNNNQYQKKNTDEIDDDDDLVISSVLPISLLCPVGKSRISCPLRGIHCQHLQCFDAHLYMMMNERRSVWKCPVCDSQATINDLFVDEFFLKIINDFAHDETITEVNVNPDGTYVPVAAKESREHKQHIGNIISNLGESDKKSKDDKPESDSDESIVENQPVICLESDDEDSKNEPIDQKPIVKLASVNTISSSTTSSSVSTENVNTHKPAAPGSMTIDLTSDSEEERDHGSGSKPTISPPVSKPVSSVSQPHTHNRMLVPAPPPFQNNRPTVSQSSYNLFIPPHQNIAPKLSHSNNFHKLTDSLGRPTGTLNYHPHSQTALISSSSCSTVSIAPSADPISLGLPTPFQQISSQPSLDKVPSFLWMTSNASSTSHQRFPGGQSRTTELLNSYLPQLKPCFPALPGFGGPGSGLGRPAHSTAHFPLPHASNTAVLSTNLLPRPPLQFINQSGSTIRPRDPRAFPGKININAAPPQATTSSSSCTTAVDSAHKPQASSHSPVKKQKIEISRLASGSARNEPRVNVNARRSSRILNQHRKMYRERSRSVEDDSSSSSSASSTGGSSGIRAAPVGAGVNSVASSNQTGSTAKRQKRWNALADSSESSVSSSLSSVNSTPAATRKRKRLVADGDDGSDGRERDCDRQAAASSTGSVVRDLRAQPLLILHKLDPVVLKLYSQQTDSGNHLVSGPGNSHVVPMAMDTLETAGCHGDGEMSDDDDNGGRTGKRRRTIVDDERSGAVAMDGVIESDRAGSAPEEHEPEPDDSHHRPDRATRFTTSQLNQNSQSDCAGVAKALRKKPSISSCHGNGGVGPVDCKK